MIFLFLSLLCRADFIDPNTLLAPDTKIKESLPVFRLHEKAKVSNSVRLESFSGGVSGAVTYTTQTMLLRERKGDRQKVAFQSLSTSSTVQVPGFGKPMVNRHDFTPFLREEEIEVGWKIKAVESMDGLVRLRESLGARISDPVMKMGLQHVFGERVVRSTISSLRPDSFCTDDFLGKKIGDRWKSQRVLEGSTLAFECEFEGWAKVKGENLALVKILIPRQDQVRANGAAADAKVEGDGKIIWHPKSGEIFFSVKTKISLLATSSISADNRSIVESRTHFFPQ